MKKIPGIVSIVVVFSVVAVFAAEGHDEVRELLEGKISSILQVLEQENLSDMEKREKTENIVDPVFDYKLMAKLAMGPRHWPRLSSDQKETFSRRFIKRMKDSYFDKITMYSGDQDAEFEYGSPAESNGKVHMPVSVRTDSDKIEMIYKFYRSGEDWKIYDVELNGVSIIKSYRSQFNEVLADGSIEDLLEELKTSDEF